jgi:hypothetical protein
MDIGILVPIIAISIPVVAIAASTVNKWIKLREKQLEFGMTQAAERAAQYAANGAELEQRMRVLERIVTDKSHDIADEIERLRDAKDSDSLRSN